MMAITSNRVTILVPDNGVYLDQGAFNNLPLDDCGIPPEIRALDWRDGKGELHHYDISKLHISITELPQWALNCIAKFEERMNLNSGPTV